MAFNRTRGRDDRSGRGGGFRPSFRDRGNRGPAEMFPAICDNCGNPCKVPFRPSADKPVYCNNCFGDKKHAGASGKFNGRSEEANSPSLHLKIDELNSKMDKILSLLSPTEAVGIETPKKSLRAKKLKVQK